MASSPGARCVTFSTHPVPPPGGPEYWLPLPWTSLLGVHPTSDNRYYVYSGNQ